MDTTEWLAWAFHVVTDFVSRLSQITLFIKQYKGHDIWILLIQKVGCLYDSKQGARHRGQHGSFPLETQSGSPATTQLSSPHRVFREGKIPQ